MKQVNGHSQREQQILRELQSPELQAILRADRPTPPNRAAARAMGAKNRADAFEQEVQRAARIERFRERTCDRWLQRQLRRHIGRFLFVAFPRKQKHFLRAWLFGEVIKRPGLMYALGYSCSVVNGIDKVKGRTLPVSVLRVRWLFRTVSLKRYAWEG